MVLKQLKEMLPSNDNKIVQYNKRRLRLANDTTITCYPTDPTAFRGFNEDMFFVIMSVYDPAATNLLYNFLPPSAMMYESTSVIWMDNDFLNPSIFSMAAARVRINEYDFSWQLKKLGKLEK